MIVSFWSFLVGFTWLTVVLLLLERLRRHIPFFTRYGAGIFLTVTVFAALRTVVPLDLPMVHVFHSWHVLAALWHTLALTVAGGVRIWHILAAVWLAGFVFFAIREISAGNRMLRRLRDNSGPAGPEALRVAADLGLRGDQVAVSAMADTPMVAGLLRPRIYLPDVPLPDEVLRWVLLHEKFHLTHGDSLIKLFCLVVRCFLWWNPALLHFRQSIDDMLEFRCDRGVLKGRPARDRADYLTSIQYVARRMQGDEPLPATTATFVGEAAQDNVLIQRALAILQMNRQPLWLPVATLLLCAALFVGSYFVIWQPAFDSPSLEEDGWHELIIDPETFYILHTPDGVYRMWEGDKSWGVVEEEYLDMAPYNELPIIEEGDRSK